MVRDDDYKKLRRKLNNHFLPKKTQHHARYTFNKQKKNRRRECCHIRGATARKTKGLRIREQIDDRVLEHLIQTIKDSELVKRSIQKKSNLDQFLEEPSQREEINQQVKDMKEYFKISKVGHESEGSPLKSSKWGRGRNSKKKPPRPPGKRDRKKEEKKKGKSFGYCGKTEAHPPGRNKIHPEGTLQETNELRIKTVKTPDDSIETVLREYSDVLQGISCFREKNTGKKIEVKLEMETDIKPVAQKPRPVPYHLQKPIKDWLDQ